MVHDVDSSRFGKVEFRDFYDEVSQNSRKLLKSEFSLLTDEQLEQLSIYLDESWGNKRRIDYGSGHELNFMCLLYGLYNYGVFNLSNDSTNLILKVFIEYLDIMRVLETKYWLEPAGSHGVWGL